MSGWSVHEIAANNGTVRLTLRQWDGIDRPDYIWIELEHDEARRHSKALMKHAATAERHGRDARKQRRDAAIKKRDELTAEIERLDREIGATA